MIPLCSKVEGVRNAVEQEEFQNKRGLLENKRGLLNKKQEDYESNEETSSLIRIFDMKVLDTHARKTSKSFGFFLAYSYLCTYNNIQIKEKKS